MRPLFTQIRAAILRRRSQTATVLLVCLLATTVSRISRSRSGRVVTVMGPMVGTGTRRRLIEVAEIRSAGRPAHGTSAEQMQMEVRHRLAGCGSDVGDDAIAVLQAALGRNLAQSSEQRREQGGVLW